MTTTPQPATIGLKQWLDSQPRNLYISHKHEIMELLCIKHERTLFNRIYGDQKWSDLEKKSLNTWLADKGKPEQVVIDLDKDFYTKKEVRENHHEVL